jgi:hypothetical protein
MSFAVNLDADEYREWTRAAETPTAVESLIDQWVDWGDHTMQVDPMGNKQWIHDSHDGHRNSEKRGRYYDSKEVNNLLGWEKVHKVDPISYYTPTSSQITGMNKLATTLEPDMWGGWKMSGLEQKPTPHARNGCKMWRGDTRDPTRIGMLPAISALLYDNTLTDQNSEHLDFDMREGERTRAARLYSRDGWGQSSAVNFSPLYNKHR